MKDVQRVLDVVIALLGVAVVTAVGWSLSLNGTTVVVAFFLSVLGLSIWRGIVAGIAGSLAGAACFNYFFLPPIGTFTVADPANWVALCSFLVASTVASRLVGTARTRAEEADARRREVEGLYELSLDLFAATNRAGALGEAAGKAIRALGAAGGGLVLFGDGEPAEVEDADGEPELLGDPMVAEARRRGEAVEVPGPGGDRDVYLPLVLGGKPSGVLVARRVRAERAALESVARLVALAVERERLLEESAHLEALRESDRLKTSLLRAVSHDLRSPLTAIRLGVGSLQRLLSRGGNPEAQGALDEVERETARLSRRIDNLLTLARLEAGVVAPRPEPTPAPDLLRSVREALASVLAGREARVHIQADCPELLVDPGLAVEILVNLVENALRVSPAGVPVEVSAARDPGAENRVRVEVLDRGPGIPSRRAGPTETDAEGTPGGRRGHGLGLQIAYGLASACGGDVKLMPRPGGGTIARVDLPAAPPLEEEP